MSTYSSTPTLLANVHRFGRFYLASVLLGLLAMLLLLSAHRESAAAPQPARYASLGPARQLPAGRAQPRAGLRPHRGRLPPHPVIFHVFSSSLQL